MSAANFWMGVGAAFAIADYDDRMVRRVEEKDNKPKTKVNERTNPLIFAVILILGVGAIVGAAFLIKAIPSFTAQKCAFAGGLALIIGGLLTLSFTLHAWLENPPRDEDRVY